MPITLATPLKKEELIFYDDFSGYSLGAFTGGGVYTPVQFGAPVGSQSWSIQSGNILRGAVTSVGHGALRSPAYVRNGRARIKVRRRETAVDPNPDNEQAFVMFKTEGIYARIVGDEGGVAKINGNGIVNTTITFSPNVWYILEVIIHGPELTATQYSEGGTPLISLSGLHGGGTSAGFVSFGIAYDANGSLDFDWVEVYKGLY